MHIEVLKEMFKAICKKKSKLNGAIYKSLMVTEVKYFFVLFCVKIEEKSIGMYINVNSLLIYVEKLRWKIVAK